jgi:hypothetical protein
MPPGLAVVYGRHVGAVGIAQEHSVITGVALGPLPEADRLAQPDRGESAQVEVEGRLDVLHLEADVIKQVRSLATSYEIQACASRGKLPR